MNRHICAVVFTNSNYKLQYLHGMTPVMENSDLKHISGSLYDSVDNLAGTAKLDAAALGYSVLICKKDLVPAGSMIGEVLTEDHLKNTTHEGKNETDLVLRSVPLVFFVPMTWDHVRGCIKDDTVVDTFSALAGNDKDPYDWIHCVLQAIVDTGDIANICTNIRGDEEGYTHPSYDSTYWPFYAPLINLAVVDPVDMPPEEFASICSIMGIKSVSSVPTPPAALASATTTIFVKEDDKNEKADIAELITFYKGLLMNGDIDWGTNQITNLQEPALTLAFTNSLKKSSVTGRAKALKTAWTGKAAN